MDPISIDLDKRIVAVLQQAATVHLAAGDCMSGRPRHAATATVTNCTQSVARFSETATTTTRHTDIIKGHCGGSPMNKPNKSPWWASMRFHQEREPAPDTDYADMGTAFGLDASLRHEDEITPVAGGDAGPTVDRLNRRSVI